MRLLWTQWKPWVSYWWFVFLGAFFASVCLGAYEGNNVVWPDLLLVPAIAASLVTGVVWFRAKRKRISGRAPVVDMVEGCVAGVAGTAYRVGVSEPKANR